VTIADRLMLMLLFFLNMLKGLVTFRELVFLLCFMRKFEVSRTLSNKSSRFLETIPLIKRFSKLISVKKLENEEKRLSGDAAVRFFDVVDVSIRSIASCCYK